MNQTDARKVIGYFASDGAHLLLDNKACIVTGGEQTISQLMSGRRSLDGFGNPLTMQARKIRFAAIMQGLEKGGSYAFDEMAYRLFYPLANQYGYALGDETFDSPAGHVTVQAAAHSDIQATTRADSTSGIPLVIISR